MGERINHNSLSQDIDNLNQQNIDSVHERLLKMADGLSKFAMGNSEIKIETTLKKAKKIVDKYQGKEKQKRILQEYQDLAKVIQESIQDNNKITEAELGKIRLELQHIQSQQDKKSEGINWFVDKASNLITGTTSKIGERNIKTADMIDQAYGDGTFVMGFSGENLVAYDSQKGNYIISAQEVEKKIKNGEILHRKFIGTYILHMRENYRLDTEFADHLHRVFGDRKGDITKLLIEGSDDSHVQKAVIEIQKVTQTKGYENTLNGFWKYAESIGNYFSQLWNYLTDAEEELNKPSGCDIEKVVDELTKVDARSELHEGQEGEVRKKKQEILKLASDPDSPVSKNAADIPSKTKGTGGEIGKVGKITTYNTHLEKTIASDKGIQEAKKTTLNTLKGLLVGFEDSEIQNVFEQIKNEIRKGATAIETTEQLKKLLAGKEIPGHKVSDAIKMVFSQSLHESKAKIETSIKELHTLQEKINKGELLNEKEKDKLITIKHYITKFKEVVAKQNIQTSILLNGGNEQITQYLEGKIPLEALQRQVKKIEKSKSVQDAKVQNGEYQKILEKMTNNVGKPGHKIPDSLLQVLENNTKNSEGTFAAVAISTVHNPKNNFSPEKKTEIENTYKPVLLERAQSSSGAKDILLQQSLNNLEKELGDDNPFVQELKQARKEGQQKLSVKNSQQQKTNTEHISKAKTTLTNKGFSPEEINDITEEELQTISESEEALNNFVDFKRTLSELNLEEFWDYRTHIFQAIKSQNAASGLETQDDNYLSKPEVSLFIYTIADSISELVPENEKTNIDSVRGNKQDLSKTSQLMRTLNRQDNIVANQEDASFVRNESRVGKIFREEYFPEDDVTTGFKTGDFLESLRK